MMKYIDYLFWSYYCFFNRHPKIYFGDNKWQAILVIYSTIIVPLASAYALLDLFVIDLPDLPDSREGKCLIVGIVSLPIFLILNHRYYHNKAVIKNHFQLFKKKWGEDPRVNKKRRIIVIIYTISTSFLPFLGPVILHFIYS